MNDERRNRQRLGAADHAIWEEVKKSIEPLPGRREISQRVQPVAVRPAAAAAPPKPRAKIATAVRHPPPLAALDRRARQRLARGLIAADDRLDLHGFSLDRARTRLLVFLESAQARGARVVLVITGKGERPLSDRPMPGERGLLRRQVPLWLALPALRPLVVGF
jgi:DNA-nicking Smr family endonuclease